MELCSRRSGELGEPLAGTAPVAGTWLLLEQPGPWGRDALTESHLDRDIGTQLAAAADQAGVRILLIRRPGRHPDLHVPQPRQVYAAHTTPRASRLTGLTVDDPKALLDLDLPALAQGAGPRDIGAAATAEPEPLFLICTNARRDRCCALLGRPAASTLARRHGRRVWESAHLGGHRFAPTGLLLPHGLAYGRLSDESALMAVEEARAGRVALHGYRGRSTWQRPGQAAEIAVRRMTSVVALDALDARVVAEPEAGRHLVEVTHVDGRSWRVHVRTGAGTGTRPESCGADPSCPVTQVVTDVEPLWAAPVTSEGARS
ncbi:MAG: sucrase ferredoxin [Carbonactinosporaceae bacterium]